MVDFPVVVSVGTDKHPFDRLIAWIDEWASENRDIGVFVQYGNSAAPVHASGTDLIPHAELLQMMAQATVVVSHGGPSTVMDVRSQRRMPVVVARNPEFGEHVDEHQMRFADHLGRHGMALSFIDKVSLHRQIESGLAEPQSLALDAVEQALPDGVQAFAEHMDGLLGLTET